MPATESIELKDVRRLNLRPGDTLVARLDDSVSSETITAIQGALKAHFPDNTILVLSGASEVEVIEAAA